MLRSLSLRLLRLVLLLHLGRLARVKAGVVNLVSRASREPITLYLAPIASRKLVVVLHIGLIARHLSQLLLLFTSLSADRLLRFLSLRLLLAVGLVLSLLRPFRLLVVIFFVAVRGLTLIALLLRLRLILLIK